MKHNCFQQGKNGEYVYLCSRCRTCYVCKHVAILMGDGTWMWKSKKGKLEEVILDGRLYER